MKRFELFIALRYLRAKRKQAVISVITVISILGVAAGVGEELLFRGALQPRLGNISAAFLFAALHTQYAVSLATLEILVLGLVLGLLRGRAGTTGAILAHAGYFKDVNRDVLNDPRVVVYVNDGRHHLQMQPEISYDLITLEPPPIVHAGVAALYSKEFYARARARLTPKGYMSQWLPAFGVPQSMILAMIRSFVDVFPDAVVVQTHRDPLRIIASVS